MKCVIFKSGLTLLIMVELPLTAMDSELDQHYTHLKNHSLHKHVSESLFFNDFTPYERNTLTALCIFTQQIPSQHTASLSIKLRYLIPTLQK